MNTLQAKNSKTRLSILVDINAIFSTRTIVRHKLRAGKYLSKRLIMIEKKGSKRDCTRQGAKRPMRTNSLDTLLNIVSEFKKSVKQEVTT